MKTFLSLLDDRAKPKGSRDPLGFELVWTHYGRQIIGNLTTITSSLNNFSAAILGFKWANELHGDLPPSLKQAAIRETFLRYEQLAGYLRYIAGDPEIMGITRVSARIDDHSSKISLGLAAEQQILSDQASYGLWGLYSAAMRESGLIRDEGRVPTSLGESIAQQIEKRVDKPTLVNLLSKNKQIPREVLSSHAKSFLSSIRRKSTQKLLLHSLMKGNDNHPVQRNLWDVTQSLAQAMEPIQDVPSFVRKVKEHTDSPPLKQRLKEIEAIERILVAANNIFHYCRRKDGEPVQNVIKTLNGRYHYNHIQEKLDLTGIPRSDLLISIRSALLSNDISKAISNVLELNKIVMAQRGGAPWVELEHNKTLRVRVQSETAELRSQASIVKDWDYDYFLSSFIKISSKSLGAQWTVP